MSTVDTTNDPVDSDSPPVSPISSPSSGGAPNALLNWGYCGNAKDCRREASQLCGRCGMVYYCSPDCMQNHRESHKGVCQIACKPGTAVLEKSFDNLEKYQLRNLVIEKSRSFEESKREQVLADLKVAIASNASKDKSKLLSLVKQHCKINEIERLLQWDHKAAEASSQLEKREKVAKDKLAKKADEEKKKKDALSRVTTPSPDEMIRQSAVLRQMVKSNNTKQLEQLRKDNATFASKSNEEILEYCDLIDEQAKDMIANPEKYKDPKNVDMSKLTVEDVKKNAEMMRKNPDLARKATKEMSNMTDEEIIEQADKLLELTKDPVTFEMYKKQMSSMKNMTPENKSALSYFQKFFEPNFTATDDWINGAIKLAKSNSRVIKELWNTQALSPANKGQGADSDQISYFVDTLMSLPDWVLFYLYKTVAWIKNVAFPPAVKVYDFLDKWTFGFAKNILMGILIMIVYVVFVRIARVLWWAMSFFWILAKGFYRVLVPGGASAPVPPSIVYDASAGVQETVNLQDAFNAIKSSVSDRADNADDF